jgi:hypothetical protein
MGREDGHIVVGLARALKINQSAIRGLRWQHKREGRCVRLRTGCSIFRRFSRREKQPDAAASCRRDCVVDRLVAEQASSRESERLTSICLTTKAQRRPRTEQWHDNAEPARPQVDV